MDEQNTKVVWDILVVGSGPAGLAAAINGRIREKSVLVLGAEIGSSRLKKAPEINNYPGIPGISGEELQNRFLDHARKLGAVVEQERIESIYPGKELILVTRGNQMCRARSVILATGIQQARFLPGEKELLGRGLGYCATCDGPLYRDKEVAVIGEIPEAEEDVNFLAEICKKVHYFPRYKEVGEVNPRVEVHHERPQGVLGREQVTGLALPEGELPVAGVFIIRDVAPAEQLVEGLEIKDSSIVVSRDMETNIPGIFAAGDCTGKPYQVGKAVGEGLTAALSAVRYLDGKKKD